MILSDLRSIFLTISATEGINISFSPVSILKTSWAGIVKTSDKIPIGNPSVVTTKKPIRGHN